MTIGQFLEHLLSQKRYPGKLAIRKRNWRAAGPAISRTFFLSLMTNVIIGTRFVINCDNNLLITSNH